MMHMDVLLQECSLPPMHQLPATRRKMLVTLHAHTISQASAKPQFCMQAGCEWMAESINKVHVQKAASDEDCWRYILHWRRLPHVNTEVRYYSC